MLQKMTKKMTLFFALSCVLSLGIGVVLGYGIQAQGLAGTAVPNDTISDAVKDGAGMDLFTRMMVVNQERSNLLNQQIEEQVAMITQLNEEIKEAREKVTAGTLPKSDVDSLHEKQRGYMARLQMLIGKYNETIEILTSIISKQTTSLESLYKDVR